MFETGFAESLERSPRRPIHGVANGVRYTAQIAIPDYPDRISRHYGSDPRALDMGIPFRHFGLVVEFADPIELEVHDAGRTLDTRLRTLLNRFGPLRFCNATMPDCVRSSTQRNVFESLNFHIDRGQTQPDNISLFWRDPRDPVQRAPRNSQTLVLANAAAYLQAEKQGEVGQTFKSRYTLFEEEDDMESLIGDVVLELGWRAPEGTGEIALVDNHRMLHASYYRNPWDKGYPISVRYLF